MSEKRKEVRYIAQKFANAILADASSYIISTDGLQALNAFLDELLFILVDTAKGLETTRIKSAVYQIFPTALGKNAIVEAELEAKSYIDMGGKDTSNHLGNSGQSATSSLFNADSDETRVEQVFEQFRTKCQYYSKLGERLGSPAGNPSNAIVVPTLIAIYVTAVLEHIAEYVLQIASTIADRQDHADMVTVREIYVALLEDRQIEHTFEIMILKTQLQKRFRHSLIMPGTGPRPEEQQPATVKRSGSWGKQLRLGNADKPKLDVQLPTDFEEDDTPIDPNRPQFGDWDEPPDEENKAKKKSDFEMLFSSGETMKVSLTPNRLRTIEVHRKAGGAGGPMASRSNSRAASVIGGKEGKSHGRRPSHGATAAAAAAASANGPPTIGARKSSQAPTAVDTHAQPPVPATPSVPAIPANFGVSQPILKKQGQHGAAPDAVPLSPMQNMQLRQQQQQQQPAKGQQPSEYNGLGIANKSSSTQMENGRASTSTFESQLTLSTAGASSMTPSSPVTSRSPVSPTGSIKSPAQATNDLVNLLGGSSPQSMYSEHGEPPMSPTIDASQTKKENPIKSFMGRLGRNSIQRTSMDSNISNPAPSPTSIRSFNTTNGGAPASGSTSGSTNGSVSSGYSGQTSMTTAPYQGSGQNVYDQPPLSPNRPSPIDQRQNMGFPMPPDSSSANRNLAGAIKPSSGAYNKPPPGIPTPLNMVAAHPNNFASSPPALHHQQQKPMSPDVGGFPIPSRNASLNHDLTSPTKTTFTNNYDTRTGLEAGLPRPLSPRPASPRPSSPRPSSPLQSPQTHQPHPLRNNSLENNGQGAGPGGILAPSPLSNSISGSNISPSSSSTSLIMYGKVSLMQDQLTKTAQPPVHGFKPQEHLQKHPNRISLEGTIRANPFYQQDRSSVRSSLADLSSTAGSSPNSAEISTLGNNYNKSGSVPGTPTALPTSAFLKVAATPTSAASAAVGSSSDSDASSDQRDEDEKRGMSNRDGMVSPATSPEMGTLKDRLPSATTRTLAATSASAAALFAAKQQHQNQQHQMATPPVSESNQQFKSTEAANQDDEASLSSPTKRRASVGSQNATANRQLHVYADRKASGEETLSPEEEEEEGEEEEEEDEEIPYVAVVPRSVPGGANRHSIFVDEAAQAMDALSRARHRQSMRLEGEEVDDEDDEEDEDEDYPHGIAPPEKWHYSDLEDEDEDEEDENDDDSVNGERRRRHESFMSAKSTFMPNGSSVSLVSAYAGQDDDEDDSSIEGGNYNKSRHLQKDTQEEVDRDQIREREVQSLEVQSSSEKQQQQEMSSSHQDLMSGDFVKDDEYTAERLIPVGGSDDEEDRNGEDEDESESSEDLEDNDDEEGQDRRIYLQQLRHQAREARRLERLANGGVDSKKKKKSRSSNDTTTSNAGARHIKKVPSLDSTGGSSSGLKKKTLRKGHSKENLRDQDRPQTPTTPVPTTQIIPLTPTDFVLIRQKLFAAGNFEASMRMLDTIFHAAMAKMVEGRERGVQTEPMAVSEVQVQVQENAAVAAVADVVAIDEAKKVEIPIVKAATVSTSISTSTDDLQQDAKKKTWVDTAVETPAVAPIEDDDDEDRVVEWLLAGW